MATRSLNKAQLIGNLTRDPELRYTPQGTAVCTIGLATNRSWVTESGDKREDTEFHRIVAWNKLAELCSQLLFKGRKIFVEGRLQTRQWTAQDGTSRQTTEIVISDMIILDSKRQATDGGGVAPVASAVSKDETVIEVSADQKKSPVVKEEKPTTTVKTKATAEKSKKKSEDTAEKKEAVNEDTEVKAEDIPF